MRLPFTTLITRKNHAGLWLCFPTPTPPPPPLEDLINEVKTLGKQTALHTTIVDEAVLLFIILNEDYN